MTIRSNFRKRERDCILTCSTVNFNLGRLLAETRRKCPDCVFCLVFQSVESANKVGQSHIVGHNISGLFLVNAGDINGTRRPCGCLCGD